MGFGVTSKLLRHAGFVASATLFFFFGIVASYWTRWINTPEFESIVGSFLGSVFAIGGAAYLWRVQSMELARRAGDAVQAICATPAGMFDDLSTLFDGVDHRMFHPSVFRDWLEKVVQGIEVASGALKRFSPSWSSMSAKQIKLLISVEHSLNQAKSELVQIKSMPDERIIPIFDNKRQKFAAFGAHFRKLGNEIAEP